MPIPLGILAVAGAGAGGGAAYDLLETTLISSNTASVTFSSLGSYSNYKHLQLRIVARDDTTEQTWAMQLNGDTGSNYARHALRGNGSSVSSFNTTSATQMSILYFASGGNAGANIFGSAIVDILDFSNTSKNTTVRSFTGVAGGPNNGIYLYSGLWNNTSAVTSITVKPFTTGNFVSGTRLSLYGIK